MIIKTKEARWYIYNCLNIDEEYIGTEIMIENNRGMRMNTIMHIDDYRNHWLPQGQQVGLISASLNIGNLGRAPTAPGWQAQQSTLGLQVGFSQTSSHLGLGHSGLWHFQSHLGSSQTASHSGRGAWQWVTHLGALQMVTHLGQSSASQALSGHLIY